jgi:hypothetical protein
MMNGKRPSLKIIGTFLVIMIMISSVRVVFAEQDIAQMLYSWMDNKRSQSIHELEQSIALEQAEQTNRLKSEIQQAITSAEKQHQEFLENEKLKRINSIEDYADKLIETYDVKVNSSEDVTKKLDCIARNAEIEMDIVLGLTDKSALKDCGELASVNAGNQVEESVENPVNKENKNESGENPEMSEED